MRKRQRVFLMFLSFIVSALLIYGMYTMQVQYIRAEQMVPILVANKWLPSGHIVLSTDVRITQYPKSLVTEDMYVLEHDLINKELIIPLGKGEPFSKWKLNSFHLLPKKNEATFQIPSFYIKSIANDVRAGDYIYIYSSNNEGKSELLFSQPVKVASVKSSTNNEIESVLGYEVDALLQSNETALYQHRRKASGIVEHINLNLLSEQWLMIDERCKDGQAQLIIAYTPYFVEQLE